MKRPGQSRKSALSVINLQKDPIDMSEALQTVYLARHARPDWTRRDLTYHLPPGPPLTSQGRMEAERLGRFFQVEGVTRIYTSPLERCLRTAEIAAEVAGSPIVIDHSLTEWQPGENTETVARRIWPLFERVRLACSVDGPSALVTHGGPVAALLERLGMQPELLKGHRKYDHNNPLPPAGVWQASLDGEEGLWELRMVFAPEDSSE
jgi:broad specificity phosphatase PhoE